MDTFLHSLSQLSYAFARHTDHRRLCSEILREAIKLTGGDRGTVFLKTEEDDDPTGTLYSLIGTSLTEKQIIIQANVGVAGRCFSRNEPLIIDDAKKHPQFFPQVDKETGYQTNSILCVPLALTGEGTFGVMQVLSSKRNAFSKDDLEILLILALFVSFAIYKNTAIESLAQENKELSSERQQRMQQGAAFATTSTNERLAETYRNLPQIARSESNILIQGESGTGKEVLTKQLHLASARRDGPFIAVNCGAIPASLFESEIFGVAAGAATGTSARKGKVELAHGGTLFLDEIGEIPVHLQSKLLRVLQEKQVTPLGSDRKPKPVDFRLIVATNRDLEEMIVDKTFREDLYYRISVVQLYLPPLRERLGDIESLCRSIIDHFVQSRGWHTKSLTPGSIEKLQSYRWPGNIRELQNKIEGAMIASGQRSEILPEDLSLTGPTASRPPPPPQSVGRFPDLDMKRAKDRLEEQLITEALAAANQNKTQAAKLLGLTREGLRKAMKKFAGEG